MLPIDGDTSARHFKRLPASTGSGSPVGQAGQSCACGTRILVQDSIYDEFMAKFLAVVTSATVGDPFDPHVLVGPVISQAAADRILHTIERAVTEKMGELVTGGRRIGGDLAAGSIWINRNSDISPQSPYGGYKHSGTGRAGGLEGLHEFQQVKNIRIAMP